MKMVSRLSGWILVLCVAATLSACKEDNSKEEAVGPDLSGSWSGRYVEPGESESLTAEITHEGRSIVIMTSKEGVGHLLTGTINGDGRLQLTDSYDGETWTSYGDVTENYVRIRDYLMDLSDEGDIPEQDIYLTR